MSSSLSSELTTPLPSPPHTSVRGTELELLRVQRFTLLVHTLPVHTLSLAVTCSLSQVLGVSTDGK